MTLSLPLRAIMTGLALSAIAFVPAQSNAQSTPTITGQAAGKPAVAQGPFQPQAQASPFNGKVVEDVVTRVNSQIITSSDYERADQQMDADGKQQGWTEQELADRKKNLLRDLIDKELLLSKGKELSITGETELIKRLDEIRKQNHLDSMEDLEKAAQQQGVSYEDFKQNIRNEIVSQEVIRDQVSRHIQMTKVDVNNFYQEHKGEFEQPESVHLSEILIPVPADDPAGLSQAQARASEVEAKLKAGGNFEDLSKEYSTGQTAQTGGDLGDYKRGQLPKVLEDAAFRLQAGGVTAPIRTKQGLLIMKVTQHTGGSQDYAAVEPQVEEAAFMSRMQPALRTYLTTLREQAYIDVRPGFTDSGAASHSVKPLYSAYTPPNAKKKKKVQRVRFRQAAHAFRSKSKDVTPAPTNQAAVPAGSTGAPAAVGQTVVTGQTTPAANSATPPAASKVATNTASTQTVKKQKVRFGQAPRDTLAATPGSATIATTSEGSAAPAETQVANNSASDSALPGMEPTTAAPKVKTRFTARAHEGKKQKAVTQDQLENKAAGPVTTEEQAAQQEQAAPLGLAGDTAKKKKQPKVKSDQKTRYAGQPKSKDDSQPTPDGSTAPALTPPASTPPSSNPPASAPPVGTAMPSPAAAPSPTAPSDPNPSPALQQTAPQ